MTGWPAVVLSTLHYLGALTFAGATVFEVAIARDPTPGPLRAVVAGSGLVATAAAALLVLVSLPVPAWGDAHGAAWPAVAVAVVTGAGVAGGWMLARRGGLVRTVAVAPAIAVAVAPVLTGHSVTLGRTSLVVADGAHLAAASVWLGGLVGLSTVLAASGRGPGVPPDPGWTLRVVRRFSSWALGSVAVVAGTGLAVAAARVGGAEGLVGTPYGRLLVVKVLLVGLVVVLAAVNRNRVVPAILCRAEGPDGWSRLRRLVAYEVGVLVAVVVVTGVLTHEPGGPVGGP